MALLRLTSFIAAILAIGFLTLCLASGLLCLAELIEENTQAAKRSGKLLIQAIIVIHVGLYLSDGLPLHLILLGIFSHLVYLSNFSNSWPSISLTSLPFLSSCALVIIDHFSWFFYFSERANHHLTVRRRFPHGTYQWEDRLPSSGHSVEPFSFLDISTFFAICVWLVPFFIFLSLSASDNVLPNAIDPTPPTSLLFSSQRSTVSDKDGSPQDIAFDSSMPHPVPALQPLGRPPHSSLLKTILQSCLASLPRTARTTVGRTSSRPNQGLISPHINSSPAFSPRSTSPPESPIRTHPAAIPRRYFSPSAPTTSPRRAFSNSSSPRPLIIPNGHASVHQPRTPTATSSSPSFSYRPYPSPVCP